MLGSTLDEILRRGPTPGGVPLVRGLVRVGWIVLGLALALQGAALGTGDDPLRAVYGLLGLLAVVLPALVLLPDRRSTPPPEGGPTQPRSA